MAKSEESLIARRYAKAFYELAEDAKKIDTVLKDIESLRSLDEVENFTSFLKNPLISRNDQLDVIQALAKKAKLDKLTVNFLGVVVENGRLPLLFPVLDAVEAEIADRRGEVKAVITAARSLTAAQIKKITDTLKTATGTEIDVEIREDEGIIGGLVIQVGSLMVDQSVRTRLNRLERALKSEAAAGHKNQLRDAA